VSEKSARVYRATMHHPRYVVHRDFGSKRERDEWLITSTEFKASLSRVRIRVLPVKGRSFAWAIRKMRERKTVRAIGGKCIYRIELTGIMARPEELQCWNGIVWRRCGSESSWTEFEILGLWVLAETVKT